MIYLAYDIATTAAAPFGAAWLCTSRRHRRLLERFKPAAPELTASPIWIQACSVGEVTAAKAIVARMRSRWPDIPVLLTTSTVSGRDLAERTMGDVPVSWFPFDHRLSVTGFLRRVRPRCLVLVETEIWPNVLRLTDHAGIPSVIVSGRLSDRHMPRYDRYRRFLRPILSHLCAAGMQNNEYAERLASLGVSHDRIRVTGSTKFDGVVTDVSSEVRRSTRLDNGFAEDGPILLFGSTRPGDEELAAQCWSNLRSAFPDWKLVIAPRHPARIDEAMAPFEEPVLRRSDVRDGRRAPSGERVFFLDTTGELVNFYGTATVAVVGGSFFPGVEGHNPLEPAALGVPTVFGPYMRNFIDPAKALADAQGAVQVLGPDALADALPGLLADADVRNRLAERGRAAIAANQGAIERTLDLVESVLAAAKRREGAG
ncbi:MAG: 3-deoxy-D-manno-octulosonic acid transferase [bacterium]|nr:3-deoxy-D-manno-octulosonic acid transferase [bacterium]